MSDALRLAGRQRTDAKTKLKIWLGKISASLNSNRAIENYKHPNSNSKLVDRLILSYLSDRSVSENRDKFFERLHSSFWSGNGGEVFSENCDHRFEDLFLAHQIPDFQQLEKLMESNPSINRIVEIGTSSGLFLEYLVANLSQIESAIGLDINETQIRENLAKPKSPKIDYFAGDAKKWISENLAADTLYVSNGGVLEYFTRSSLDQLLQMVGRLPRVAFYTSEPVAIDHDEKLQESIPFGNELSFSHNYHHLFMSNGFDVRYQRSTEYVADCGTKFQMLVTISTKV